MIDISKFKTVYQSESFTLICADSVENVALFNGVADLVVTDPPYELTSGGKETGQMGGCFSPNIYNNGGNFFEGDIPSWDEIMSIVYGSMKINSHAYVMSDSRNMRDMLNAAHDAKLRFHNILEWRKGTYTPNRWYMKGTEFVGFFFTGKAKYINDCGSRQDLYVPQVDATDHPTEKPVLLFEHYILNSSHAGEVVFDPFMGSGTAGVAAVKNGRRFIGVERDRKWFDVAVQRLNHAISSPEQQSLFGG